MVNHPNRSKKAPPKAAREYMRECDETEAEFREWVLRQVDGYNSVTRPGIDLGGHLAFKMGCTRAGAEAVLNWAQVES